MLGFTTALEGLTNSEAQFDHAAQQIAAAPVAVAAGQDTVDLSTAAVAVLEAKNNFDANTKVIKIGDEMQAYLLNAIG